MSDTYDAGNPLKQLQKSIFWADDKTDPRVNPDLRKRIALAMLARDQRTPKNLGEGIAAIGTALGERRMEERLLSQDAAANQRTIDASQDVLGGGAVAPGVAPPPAPVSENTVAPPPVQTAALPPPPAAASPLPPADTGAMPPEPLPVPPGTMPSIAVPPSAGAGRIPTQPGATVRDALTRAMAPAPPAPVGGQVAATDFSSQNRPAPVQAAPQAPQVRAVPRTVAEEELAQEPLTPIQQRAIARARAEPWNDELKAAMKTIYDQEEVGRSFRQGVRQKRYEELKKQQDPVYQADLAKKQAENAKEAAEAGNRATYGNLPPFVEKTLTESKANTQTAVNSLEALNNAEKAMEAGTIFGAGADTKLTWYRIKAAAGDKDAQRIVAATQGFKVAMGPVAQAAIKAYGGAQISNEDRKAGLEMSGADIMQDEQTARYVLGIAKRSAHAKIDDHKSLLDEALAKQPPLARKFFDVPDPRAGVPMTAPPPQGGGEVRTFANEAEAAAANLPRGTPVIVNGRRGKVQ